MQCHPKMVTETYSSTWWLIITRMFSKNNEHSNKSRVVVGIVGRKSLHTLYSPLIDFWPCFALPSSKYGDFRQYEPDSDVFICHLMLSISWRIGKIYHHNSDSATFPQKTTKCSGSQKTYFKNPGTERENSAFFVGELPMCRRIKSSSDMKTTAFQWLTHGARWLQWPLQFLWKKTCTKRIYTRIKSPGTKISHKVPIFLAEIPFVYFLSLTLTLRSKTYIWYFTILDIWFRKNLFMVQMGLRV